MTFRGIKIKLSPFVILDDIKNIGKKLFVQNKNNYLLNIVLLLYLINNVFISTVSANTTPPGTLITNRVMGSFKMATNATTTNFIQSNVETNIVTNLSMISILRTNIVSVSAGTNIFFSHIVTNYGNSTNAIQLIALSSNSYSNFFYMDTNRNGLFDVGESLITTLTLAPCTAKAILARENIPLTATNNSDRLTISGQPLIITNLQVRNTYDYMTILAIIIVDTNAPTPNPATLTAIALSSSSIQWTATIGSDASPPVYYLFNGNVNTNTNTGWSATQVMTLSGLSPNTYYTQRVRMRDSSTNTNTGAWSTYVGRYTHSNPPINGVLTEYNGYKDVYIVWGLNNNPNDTEYYVERANDNNFINNLQVIKNWSIGTNTTDNNLNNSMGYYYRIKGRNKDNIDTSWVVLVKPSHLDLGKKFRNNLILYCSGEKVSYYHQFKKAEDMEAIIYDITGKIVYNFGKIHGNQDDVKLLEWDGKDSQGRCCAPGYYILYVKPDKVRYKIVIW